MRCPSCDKPVQPLGLPTGFQDLIATRIHLARDHGIRKDTYEVLQIRAEQEDEKLEAEGETIFIDTDKEERWLA